MSEPVKQVPLLPNEPAKRAKREKPERTFGHYSVQQCECVVDLYLASPQATGWFPVQAPRSMPLVEAMRRGQRWQRAIDGNAPGARRVFAVGVRVRTLDTAARDVLASLGRDTPEERHKLRWTTLIAFAPREVDIHAPPATPAPKARRAPGDSGTLGAKKKAERRQQRGSQREDL